MLGFCQVYRKGSQESFFFIDLFDIKAWMYDVKILPSNTSRHDRHYPPCIQGHDQIVCVVTDLTLLQSVRNPPGTSAGSSGFLCLNLRIQRFV